jgi:hypothetical protein
MSDPTPARPNRRRFRRLKTRRTIKAYCSRGLPGQKANLALEILDLSETGIRLLLKEPLRKDHHVELNLELITNRMPFRVQGRVVWCVAAADWTHCVGVQFYNPLGYGDFRMLVET